MLQSSIDIPEALASQTTYEGLTLPLYSLYRRIQATGAKYIEGRTFTKCRLEGPAVLLVLNDVFFDGCSLGSAGSDVKNLLLKPMGSQIVGAIPFQNCRFVDCTFFAVGYTGHEDFLNQMAQVQRSDAG